MLGHLTIKAAAAGPGSPRLVTVAVPPTVPISADVPVLSRWACRRRPEAPPPAYW
jgi:hypothetical protein